MHTDDDKTAPLTDERAEARARLARQIGRLLALDWLRNRASSATVSATESSAANVSPNTDLPARPTR